MTFISLLRLKLIDRFSENCLHWIDEKIHRHCDIFRVTTHIHTLVTKMENVSNFDTI